MSDSDFYGFVELSDLLEKYAETAENILEEQEKIADDFLSDLRKLSSPRSSICKSGYTHLIDTFAKKVNGKEVEVGWGKYYGPMVERGHGIRGSSTRVAPRAHLVPCWNANAEKYIDDFKKRTNLD